MNFLDTQPIDLLFKSICNLWDLIEQGLLSEDQADEVLRSLNEQSGANLPIDDLYDIVCYIQFRRTGTPPITIH